MDSKAPSIPIRDYVSGQTRFRSLFVAGSVHAEETLAAAQAEVDARWGELVAIADRAVPPA
jgi:hypothetical protein